MKVKNHFACGPFAQHFEIITELCFAVLFRHFIFIWLTMMLCLEII